MIVTLKSGHIERVVFQLCFSGKMDMLINILRPWNNRVTTLPGIKPLFYLPLPDGGLAFASELKAIEAAFRLLLTLDPDAIIASLLYVWIPESRCV